MHGVGHCIGPGVGVPAKAVQGNVGAQAAVLVYRIGPQLPVQVHPLAVAFRHVEGTLVRGDQDAVGHSGVEGDAGDGVAAVGLRVGPQHRAVVQFLHFAGVNVAGVPGVGEPDAASPVNSQVVGGVELLPVHPVGYGRVAAVVKADDGPPAGAAAEEVAPVVEGQAVAVVGAAPRLGNSPGVGVITHNAAGGDVGKEDCLAVPDRALGNAAVGPAEQLKLILPSHLVVPPGEICWGIAIRTVRTVRPGAGVRLAGWTGRF